MSNCKVTHSVTCTTAHRSFITLEKMLEDYVFCYQTELHAQLNYFKQQDFDKALKHAAFALNDKGTRYSHQRRLRQQCLTEGYTQLKKQSFKLKEAYSFKAVFALVKTVIGDITGLGPLYAYDTALRMSAHLGYSPQDIYIHAGTKIGAKNLGLDTSSEYISREKLPDVLQQLEPHDIENFLCIYKDHFKPWYLSKS